MLDNVLNLDISDFNLYQLRRNVLFEAMAQIALDDDFLERKFTDNFTHLQEKVSKITDIVDILIEKRVINRNDRPKFLNVNKSQKQKIDDVLQEVKKKKMFNEFIFALRKTGQSTLIEKLTPNNTEFDAFIGSPEQEAVSTSTKTVIELETELKQQAHTIVKLEAEKKKIQQDIDHLKDVQQGVRRTIEEKTSRIEMLKKKNTEIEQLKKDVQQLQHDLNSSNKELKMKTENVEKLEKLYTDAVKQREEVKKQIEEDRKERMQDREERETDRKQRLLDLEQMKLDREQMKLDREQREEGMQIGQELNTNMELVLNSIAQLNIDKDENETTGTKKATLDPRKNKASNLRKKKSDKKK